MSLFQEQTREQRNQTKLDRNGRPQRTSSAVRALVMSPWICFTPSMGAMGCRSMETMSGSAAPLQKKVV
jgi:hypothetical protein